MQRRLLNIVPDVSKEFDAYICITQRSNHLWNVGNYMASYAKELKS